jgi:hypothetical protein
MHAGIDGVHGGADMTQENDQSFVSAALEFFAPLREVGYEVIDVRSTRIEFSKRLRRVVVCHNPRNGEIDVELGSRFTPFSLEEYLRTCLGDRSYANDGTAHGNDVRAGVQATAGRLFAHPETLLMLELPGPGSPLVPNVDLQGVTVEVRGDSSTTR